MLIAERYHWTASLEMYTFAHGAIKFCISYKPSEVLGCCAIVRTKYIWLEAVEWKNTKMFVENCANSNIRLRVTQRNVTQRNRKFEITFLTRRNYCFIFSLFTSRTQRTISSRLSTKSEISQLSVSRTCGVS